MLIDFVSRVEKAAAWFYLKRSGSSVGGARVLKNTNNAVRHCCGTRALEHFSGIWPRPTHFICFCSCTVACRYGFKNLRDDTADKLHWGDFPNLLLYYMGGSSQFITILHREGGSTRSPNLYHVINGWPLR